MAKSKKAKFKFKFKAVHLLILSVSLLILSFVITKNKSLSQNINLQNKQPQQTGSVDTKRIEISGVSVADFINKQSLSIPNKSDKKVQPSFYTIAKTADYNIFYIPADELFFISVTSYPFDEHRAVAQQELLKKLEITQEDACKLNVDITTPSYANPDKAGEIYGLSFCE